jgi:hypothetical protein
MVEGEVDQAEERGGAVSEADPARSGGVRGVGRGLVHAITIIRDAGGG